MLGETHLFGLLLDALHGSVQVFGDVILMLIEALGKLSDFGADGSSNILSLREETFWENDTWSLLEGTSEGLASTINISCNCALVGCDLSGRIIESLADYFDDFLGWWHWWKRGLLGDLD